MRVSTFYDDNPTVEGTLIKISGKLCVIELDGDKTRVMRHRTRVTPLDDAAQQALADGVLP